MSPSSLTPSCPAQPFRLLGLEPSLQELYHKPGLGEASEGGNSKHPGKGLTLTNQGLGCVGRNTKSHHPVQERRIECLLSAGPSAGKEDKPLPSWSKHIRGRRVISE